MLKFRHGIAVRFSREFKVTDRLKDVVTGCGESYVEGIEADHVADIGVQTQARLIELKDCLEGSLS